jgi:hypothetical protein
MRLVDPVEQTNLKIFEIFTSGDAGLNSNNGARKMTVKEAEYI